MLMRGLSDEYRGHIINDDVESLRKVYVHNDFNAYRVLTYACEKASLDIVQYILPLVRNVNTRPIGYGGARTPLGCLCISTTEKPEMITILQLLLDRGADPHKVYGQTTLTPFEFIVHTLTVSSLVELQIIRMLMDQCDCRIRHCKRPVMTKVHEIEKEVIAPLVRNCRRAIAGLLVSAKRSRLLCRDIALCIARFMWEYCDDKMWK